MFGRYYSTCIIELRNHHCWLVSFGTAFTLSCRKGGPFLLPHAQGQLRICQILQAWLAEAVLWTMWWHRGEFKAQLAEYVTVVTCHIAFLCLWFSGRNRGMKRRSSMVCAGHVPCVIATLGRPLLLVNWLSSSQVLLRRPGRERHFPHIYIGI